MSLRFFHLVFIVAAIIAFDMFGAWAIWSHPLTGSGLNLALGVMALIAGLALTVYALWFARKTETEQLT